MDESSTSAVLTGTKLTRWAARILSTLILVFWGFFIVAHLFGDEGDASRPLSASDYAGLIAMGAWLVGLAVAWKWEFRGGLTTLFAFGIAAAANSNVLSFPFVIVPITAGLFLASWWMRRETRDRIAEGGTNVF